MTQMTPVRRGLRDAGHTRLLRVAVALSYGSCALGTAHGRRPLRGA